MSFKIGDKVILVRGNDSLKLIYPGIQYVASVNKNEHGSDAIRLAGNTDYTDSYNFDLYVDKDIKYVTESVVGKSGVGGDGKSSSWKDCITLGYAETPCKDNVISSSNMKHDTGKLLFSCLTRGLAKPLKAVAGVLTYGATKYTKDSWQGVPNAEVRYEDALDRHLNEWKQGTTHDSESKLLHLAHVVTNALFLLHFEIEKQESKEEDLW